MKLPAAVPTTLRGICDKIEYSKRKRFIPTEVYSSSSRITDRERNTDWTYLQAFFRRVLAPCGYRSFRPPKLERSEWNLIREQTHD